MNRTCFTCSARCCCRSATVAAKEPLKLSPPSWKRPTRPLARLSPKRRMQRTRMTRSNTVRVRCWLASAIPKSGRSTYSEQEPQKLQTIRVYKTQIESCERETKAAFAPCHFIGLAPAQKYRSNAAAQYTAGQCEIVRWEWRLLPRPDMIWNYILMQKLSQVSAKNEKSRTIIKPMESLKILALDKSTHGHSCKSENQLSHLSTILATCRLAIN